MEMAIEIGLIFFCTSTAVLLTFVHQFRSRLKERDGHLEQLKTENNALTNRLLAREGYAPIFTESGIQVDRPIDDSPFTLLKPPFAAAEDRWKQEEKENRPPSLIETVGAVVPDLTPEQKAAMLKNYN